MPPDFLDLLASFAYDLLKALGKRLPGQSDLQRELSDALRQNAEASQALHAALTRLGAPRLVSIVGDVSGSVIVLGDGNRVNVPDNGALAQRWLAWSGDSEQARRAYRETLAGAAARHIFPLSKLSFQTDLASLYQQPAFAPYLTALTRSVWPEEVGGALGLSAALGSLTRIVAPTVGGFLLGRIGAPAPGVLGAVLMGWLVYYTWRKVLFVPDLACPEPR